MTLAITHNTSADLSFSAGGKTAWENQHTVTDNFAVSKQTHSATNTSTSQITINARTIEVAMDGNGDVDYLALPSGSVNGQMVDIFVKSVGAGNAVSSLAINATFADGSSSYNLGYNPLGCGLTLIYTTTATAGWVIVAVNRGRRRVAVALAAEASNTNTNEAILFTVPVPANIVATGSSFRVRLYGVSNSTGTLRFGVRVGNGGGISDTNVWLSATSAAQSSNARAGIDVILTFRSPTSIAADGVGSAGALVLPTDPTNPAVYSVTTTSIWYIHVTCTCSVATFTARVGSVEEII